jgi:threonine dehydrogenase-like Zn-dependent dehydrogenase
LPFNKNWTPGHEYMGTIAALGKNVDEFAIGERVTVEIHAGCGQCKRCRMGMYTSCLNYGLNYGEVDKGTAPTVSPPTAVLPSTPSIT